MDACLLNRDEQGAPHKAFQRIRQFRPLVHEVENNIQKTTTTTMRNLQSCNIRLLKLARSYWLVLVLYLGIATVSFLVDKIRRVEHVSGSSSSTTTLQQTATTVQAKERPIVNDKNKKKALKNLDKKNKTSSEKWPPLRSLIQNRNGVNKIVGNVQFLLDFAIVGHSKWQQLL